MTEGENERTAGDKHEKTRREEENAPGHRVYHHVNLVLEYLTRTLYVHVQLYVCVWVDEYAYFHSVLTPKSSTLTPSHLVSRRLCLKKIKKRGVASTKAWRLSANLLRAFSSLYPSPL